MKKYLLFIAMALCINVLNAQFIDHKGNRNQTYPDVYGQNPDIVAMINQVDTTNLYYAIEFMQQYIRECSSPNAVIVQNVLLDWFDTTDLACLPGIPALRADGTAKALRPLSQGNVRKD